MRFFITTALIWLFGSLLFGCASKQPNSQTHDVAEEGNRLWQSEELQKGDSFALKVNGESAYLCTIHPVMKGEILIER